ncbi:MAG: outer membrane protein [Roseivirga sp.]|jgi:outer membrane protein
MKNKLLILAFFFSLIISAQETNNFSLDEAIEYAIENSYQNRTASNDIKAAEKRKWETTTIGLPQIDAKIDYINNLKQQFPGVDFNQDGVVDFGAKQSITGTATLRQLLFDGSYLVGLQAAKTYLKISNQAKEKTELSTREAVINVYGNILVTEKLIEIILRNKKVNDRLLKGARIGYENGLAEQEDVEQFEITEGTIESSIKNANRMKEIAYQMLNLTMGKEIDAKLTLTNTLDDLILTNTDLNLLAQDFDLNNHIDFKIAENTKESNRLLMQLERSKALPSLSAFINYSKIANSESFTFSNSSQNWIPTSVFGVSLNVPVFSSLGRSARTAQAKIALDNSDIQLEETKQRLNLQAQQAQSNYQLSIENYEIAKKNLNLAERIESKQQIKFKEGVSTSYELLQSQNQLYSQQNNYVQAMLNIIANKAKLENALNIPIK